MGRIGIVNAFGGIAERGQLHIMKMPDRLDYVSGEPLDVSGIQVYVITAGGTPLDITDFVSYTPAVGEPVISNTVVLEYNQIYTTFKVNVVEVQPWSTATNSQVVGAMRAHRAGSLDIHDFWTISQERSLVMKSGATYTLVLADSTLMGLSPEDGITNLTFGVTIKENTGNRKHHTSDTNTGGWRDSDIRTWCNNDFFNDLPDDLKPAFIPFKWKTGQGGGSSSGLLETVDKIALPTEKMIFGSTSYSQEDEANLYNHWEWYQTASNRSKGWNWWEASPRSGSTANFCSVYYDGYTGNYSANNSSGVVPFGCI